MADQVVEGDVYVYTGGRAPQHITHAIIDKSVNEIDDEAFRYNSNLRSVKTHDGLKRIGQQAFLSCESLTDIDIRSVKILDSFALAESGLTEVDCDKLLVLKNDVFEGCKKLTHITLPSVKQIDCCAFEITDLRDLELPNVEKIGANSFFENLSLRRIAIPLKADLFDLEPESVEYKNTAFDRCNSLVKIDLVGRVHETVSSLHLESWRNDMNEEINEINQVLPNIPSAKKTATIRWWLASVSNKIEYYKGEHRRVLKEAASILELALWKVNLLEENEEESRKPKSKKAKIDVERARKEKRIRSGADIVIKNVLPFLKLN